MAFIPAAIGAIGAIFQGVSAFGQANYQRQVARNNEVIAKQNANRASDAAQIEQMRSDREYASTLGQQLAAQSASGLDVLGVSQLGVRKQTARVGLEAAQDIRRKGESTTAGYFNQAAGYAGDANAAKSSGISSLIGSGFKAAGALYDGGLFGKAKPRGK